MVRTIKGKISAVYLCLVTVIAIIGMISIVNIYNLNKSLDSLIVNNYTSINAVSYMSGAVDNQNNAILVYINSNPEYSIDTFSRKGQEFNKWYNSELNNVTEPGEKELVDHVNEDYIKYVKLFSKLQESKNSKNKVNSMEFYENSIIPIFSDLQKSLRDLSLLNEKAMFAHKQKITMGGQHSLYIIFVFSVVSVVGGFILSRYSINKSLKPIYSLRETMKSVREGDLSRQAEILSTDEVGDLANEFNLVTKKLYDFEQSTIGQLLTEKNKSMTIVKSISDPLIVLDANYRILLLNNACEKLFNIHGETIVNKAFIDIVKHDELYNFISHVYEKGSGLSEQKVFYLPSEDKELYFNVAVTIVKDTESHMDGLVVLFQNITELKQAEKMKADFISTISHELKTPLTSIIMGISLLDDSKVGDLNSKQKEVISAISEESEKLSNLIKNLLQLIKIQSKDSILSMQNTSILGVIDYSVKGFYEIAKSKDIELYYEVDDNIPKITMDAEKVTWVLNNIISNALKHTNAGDLIVVSAYKKDNNLLVSVKDTGIGIPEAYVDRVFERFVQVKDGDSDNSGTGLGLAIAKEIIELHGGSIWCESKLDVGSTFTFTLPLK